MSSVDYSGATVLAPPLLMSGPVVKGFGRGSKELGIPTANLDAAALPEAATCNTGVYYGWASVGSSPRVYQMVMSIGWNPFYKNEKKTVEPHLLHTFEQDFYGEDLRLVVCGYLRPELNFTSLAALMEAIHADIGQAKERLGGSSTALAELAGHAFLQPPSSSAAATSE